MINQIQNNRLAKVPSILSKNGSLVTPELYEQNQQQINELLLAELTDAGSMLEGQNLATLNAIAEQCPFLGGNAVYLARALLMNVQATDFSNDCPTEEEFFPGLQSKSNQDGQKGNVFLYPNPVDRKGILHIEIPIDPVSGQLRLYNTTGQPVETQLIASPPRGVKTPSVIKLTMPDQPGMYFLEWLGADGQRVVRKVIVR